MEDLQIKSFEDIDVNDPFFDSLKEDYEGFEKWYAKKIDSGAKAFVYYKENVLLDFLYLKLEEEPILLSESTLPSKKRLKVATFKIERRGSKRGERFIKKILDFAIENQVEEIYITMFNDRDELIHLKNMLETFGFEQRGTIRHANNREELVLIREMNKLTGNIIKDYPYLNINGTNKYALSIYPIYHTKLFPDSILKGESKSIVEDLSPTNSIFKIYICRMDGVRSLQKGDILAIYRTNDRENQSAGYRSVITSLCTVYEVKTRANFNSVDEFVDYTNAYSIYRPDELKQWFNDWSNFVVIKMLYNLSLGKKVINKELKTDLNVNPQYWGFFKFSDTQFTGLLQLGKVDMRYLK